MHSYQPTTRALHHLKAMASWTLNSSVWQGGNRACTQHPANAIQHFHATGCSFYQFFCRGKGEGGSGSARPPSTGRDPIPTPAAAKSKEALPRTSSHSRRSQPTQALRIDGFVRPLTVQKTQAMLSEFGEIQKLWMPSIRTHAFVVFASAEQAEKCLKATSGLNWPQGNLGST